MQVHDLCLQHLRQQSFHCSALNSDQYLNCHWTNWTMCLPLSHGEHAQSHRRHFVLCLNHFRQCAITAATNCCHSGSARQLYLLFIHLKSALTRIVRFTVPQRIKGLKDNKRKGSYWSFNHQLFHFHATQDLALSKRALFKGTCFYHVVKAKQMRSCLAITKAIDTILVVQTCINKQTQKNTI